VAVAEPITKVEQWYTNRSEGRDGVLEFHAISDCAQELNLKYLKYKTEMDARVANYWKLEKIAAAEVISEKPDLPNISSGETAGMIRRMARNLVQHTPNFEVISKFDDDDVYGIFSRWILRSKICGDDQYSNDLQQSLFASAKSALTLGFDCVIPVLAQDAKNGWYIKYDNIHYRDVFPEPGARDIRQATDVFVRRYLTKGQAKSKIGLAGWDDAALKAMLKTPPPPREMQSVDHESKKRGQIPDGYEIVTWYSNTGEPFLTFETRSKMLLRIEPNKHPLKEHPVFFLVLEKDLSQPLGKSQVELLLGRQEFQDLLLNGAMKMWYRNINPMIIGLGTGLNGTPNLGPGKFIQVGNPNAKFETFEQNSQTLLQYNQIATANQGNMVQLIGAADQQMAMQGTGGAMSQTPQGVEAQQAMVDITTNNYQKAIESFASRYAGYALTIFFQELKSVKSIVPTADARVQLLKAGLDPELFVATPAEGEKPAKEECTLVMDFSDLATEYFVRAIPGSLVEMEDEKQLRILNQLFVPLSQAMPALAASGNQQALAHATAAMLYIVEKEIELTGATHSKELKELLVQGETEQFRAQKAEQAAIEANINQPDEDVENEKQAFVAAIESQSKQLSVLTEAVAELLARQSGGQSVQSAPATAGVAPATAVPA